MNDKQPSIEIRLITNINSPVLDLNWLHILKIQAIPVAMFLQQMYVEISVDQLQITKKQQHQNDEISKQYQSKKNYSLAMALHKIALTNEARKKGIFFFFFHKKNFNKNVNLSFFKEEKRRIFFLLQGPTDGYYIHHETK